MNTARRARARPLSQFARDRKQSSDFAHHLSIPVHNVRHHFIEQNACIDCSTLRRLAKSVKGPLIPKKSPPHYPERTNLTLRTSPRPKKVTLTEKQMTTILGQTKQTVTSLRTMLGA